MPNHKGNHHCSMCHPDSEYGSGEYDREADYWNHRGSGL